MTVFPGKGYNEVKVGDTFGAAVTITDAHLVLAAGLIGDSHPLHINQQFAEQTRFGGRVLHGVLTGAIVGGPGAMHDYAWREIIQRTGEIRRGKVEARAAYARIQPGGTLAALRIATSGDHLGAAAFAQQMRAPKFPYPPNTTMRIPCVLI